MICEANPAGENSSFIFTACVKSVPLYCFWLCCVVLHMAVKEFFERIFNRSLLIVVSGDLEISFIHSI